MQNPFTSPRQQNAFLHNILERITDGFLAVDKDWRVLLWNKEAERIIQKKKQEVVGKTIWECFPEIVHLKYYPLYHKAVRNQEPVYFEEIYPPLNIRTQVSAYPSETGLTIYFKKVEERKEEPFEQRLLALIARETINAVTLLNFDGTISWVNDAFLKITGYALTDAIGKKTGQLLIGPETDPAAVDDMRQAFYEHLPFQGELLIYTKQKEQKWISIAAQPLFDAPSNTYRYFMMLTDITDQKKIIRQLEASRKESAAAIIKAQENERELIGQELHDNVNQIMATIKLFIEVSRSSPEQRDELLQRCTDLVKEAIQETRYISHRLTPPQFDDDSLEESINSLANTIRHTKQFGLRLDLSGITGIRLPKEIRLAVYRILQEHLMNIIKHADARQVDVFIRKMDNDLVVKVMDDGKGFDLAAKRTGIGLLNIKNRAESMNGSVVINSKPGLGCVLIVRFPLER
jgi:PAS domain S-box-containing protein